MIEKVFHLLTGYVAFEIQGDPARFFNAAAKSGFGFWGFDRQGDRARAVCRAREYRKLRPLARRCRVRLRQVKKRGLPFLTRRLWGRKGLLAGAVCGIGIYLFLSGFVWGVSVSGTVTLGDSQVLEAAREGGVYRGAAKSGFVPRLAARRITTSMPELKWAAVNTDGCFVEIVVGEAEEKPEIADDTRWSNIVASQPGKIVSVEAQRGRPEVSQGDAVAAGDLLISGLYQEQLEPWDPRAGNPWSTVGAARGSVIAETYREFTVTVPEVKRQLVPSGERRVNLSLELFGLRIPLGFNTAPEGECRRYRSRSALKALGVELPLSLERDVYEVLEERERALTKEELQQAALFKLREAQRDVLPQGGRVIREELAYSFPDGMCILSAKCRCREEIGTVQEVLVK